MAANPLKRMFPDGVCNAKTKKGAPCKTRKAVFLTKKGTLRCKHHGGLSTGAKTREGKAKAFAVSLGAYNERRRAGLVLDHRYRNNPQKVMEHIKRLEQRIKG